MTKGKDLSHFGVTTSLLLTFIIELIHFSFLALLEKQGFYNLLHFSNMITLLNIALYLYYKIELRVLEVI